MQEEYLLGGLMSFAVCTLLVSLKAENAQDYVYACFFLISVSGAPVKRSSRTLLSRAPVKNSYQKVSVNIGSSH